MITAPRSCNQHQQKQQLDNLTFKIKVKSDNEFLMSKRFQSLWSSSHVRLDNCKINRNDQKHERLDFQYSLLGFT